MKYFYFFVMYLLLFGICRVILAVSSISEHTLMIALLCAIYAEVTTKE